MPGVRGTVVKGSLAARSVDDPTLHATDLEDEQPTMHNPSPVGASGLTVRSNGVYWAPTSPWDEFPEHYHGGGPYDIDGGRFDVRNLSSVGALAKEVATADGAGGIVFSKPRYEVVLVDADYDMDDNDYVVVCDKATAMSVTLPAATGSGSIIVIKNIGAGTVTVDCAGLYDTIDGVPSHDLAQWEFLQVCDYTVGGWVVIAY